MTKLPIPPSKTKPALAWSLWPVIALGIWLSHGCSQSLNEVRLLPDEVAFTKRVAPHIAGPFFEQEDGEFSYLSPSGGGFSGGRATSIFRLDRSADLGKTWTQGQFEVERIGNDAWLGEAPVTIGSSWALPIVSSALIPGVLFGGPDWRVKFAPSTEKFPEPKRPFCLGSPDGVTMVYQGKSRIQIVECDSNAENWRSSQIQLTFTETDFVPCDGPVDAVRNASNEIVLAGLGWSGKSVRDQQVFVSVFSAKGSAPQTTVLPTKEANAVKLVQQGDKIFAFCLHGFQADPPDKTYFLLHASEDGGVSWKSPAKIPLPKCIGAESSHNAFTVSQEGQSLFLTYVFPDRSLFGQLSRDRGVSWTRSSLLSKDVYRHFGFFSQGLPVVMAETKGAESFVLVGPKP